MDNFGSKICKYQDDIFRDMGKLIAIPSVRGDAKPGKPFGEKSAEALECILDIAKQMGLETENVDGYAGHAEYGEGPEYAAVLAHMDVVPVGDGWNTDPFTLVQRGSLAYGRGTADDKGPAIVALYCLKVLKDEGVRGKRRLRAIFGAAEETGMEDMDYYFKKEPLPVMGFTPDGEYGICNREKGILRLEISNGNDSAVVKELHAGTVVNAVPDKAVAKIVCTEAQYQSLVEAAKLAEGSFECERTEDGASILSHGRAAHAMQPHVGINAASRLIRLLASVFEKDALGGFLTFLNREIGLETDGFSLGVKQQDLPSGDLTMNLGLLEIHGDKASAGIDIRYPVTSDGEKICATITEHTTAAGFRLEVKSLDVPLYLPETSTLISVLKDAYQAVCGAPAELYATGGGTYARAIKGRGVAFGPFFPEEPDRHLHDANEHIDMEKFMLHAQICLEAMYRMITE